MTVSQTIKQFVFSMLSAFIISGLSAILIGHSSQVLAATNPWPMFHHDPQHTGRSSQIGPHTTTRLWDFPTAGVPGSPAISNNGTIYLPTGMLNADNSGDLYAINPDGSQQWRLTLDILPSSTAPAIGPNGTIYIHGNGAESNVLAIEKLIAVSPGGVLLWSFVFNHGNASLTSYVQSSPTIGPDGTIYIGSPDTNLYALTPNGAVKWAFTPSLSGIASSPALAPDGNTLYIVDSSTTLFAYSTDGEFKWQYALTDSPMGTANDQSPSVGADGTIYVGSPDHYLYAINPNGTLQWRFQTGSQIRSTPAIGADGAIYVGSDGLYAINPNGTQRWKFANSLFSSVSPIIGGDGMLYWRESFTAYAVNVDGTQKWSINLSPFGVAGLDSTPILGSDRTLYVPTAKFFADGQNGLSAYAPTLPPTPTFTETATQTPSATFTPTPVGVATNTPSATHVVTITPTTTSTVAVMLAYLYLPVIQNNQLSAIVSPTALATPILMPTTTPTPPPTSDQVAFVSNRDGNNEIYIMHTDGSELTRLTNNTADDSNPDWSPDGTRIVFSSNRDGDAEIYVMNADGSHVEQLTNNVGFDNSPEWSPDGTKIAFTASGVGGVSDIFTMNADGSARTQLTFVSYYDAWPTWSPDGTQIAFSTSRSVNMQIYRMNADGTDPTTLTGNLPGLFFTRILPTWSPDGLRIAYDTRTNGLSDNEIYIINPDGSEAINLTNNSAIDTTPAWSPDGQKLAFVSYRDGNAEIYQMNGDGSGQIRLTNNSATDTDPAWSP